MWAYSESPLIDGDKLVCTPGGKEATLVALNKEMARHLEVGRARRRRSRLSSIIVVEAGGIKQYVQLLAKAWWGWTPRPASSCGVTTKPPRAARPSFPRRWPTTATCTQCRQVGGGLVKLKAKMGPSSRSQSIYDRNLPSSIGGAVRHRRLLYGTTGKGLQCVEFTTGNVKWQDKCVGAGSVCSPMAACIFSARKRCRGAGGGHAGSVPRKGPLHAAEPTKPWDGTPIQGLGVSGGRQWPALFAESRLALVLRCQGPQVVSVSRCLIR